MRKPSRRSRPSIVPRHRCRNLGRRSRPHRSVLCKANFLRRIQTRPRQPLENCATVFPADRRCTRFSRKRSHRIGDASHRRGGLSRPCKPLKRRTALLNGAGRFRRCGYLLTCCVDRLWKSSSRERRRTRDCARPGPHRCSTRSRHLFTSTVGEGFTHIKRHVFPRAGSCRQRRSVRDGVAAPILRQRLPRLTVSFRLFRIRRSRSSRPGHC
jgi:hypothetical protein